MWSLVLLTCTAAMLLLPLLPALHELLFKSDVQPLPIEHALRGEVGYFAASFGQRVRQWLTESTPQEAGLLRLATSAPDKANFDAVGPSIAAVALLGDDVQLPAALSLDQELYAAGHLQVAAASRLRAVLAEGRLCCGDGVEVQRWADAASVKAGRHCRFHGRVSARDRIEFGPGTAFERVSAPVIVASGPLEESPGEEARPSVTLSSLEQERLPTPDRVHPLAQRRTYWRDLRTAQAVAHQGDLVVQGHVVLASGSHIQGSIKAYQDLHLHGGSEVQGHLVARGAIRVGPGARVRGNLMSEACIHLAAGSVVGTRDQPVSITAPTITMAPGATVHGSMSAYEGGRVG